MHFLNMFFFDIYPYIAGSVFLIGSWLRYDYGQYTWRAASSQMLDRKGMNLASNLFHIGILGIFAGHFLGMLTPHWMYESFLPIDVKQKMAMIAGGACGVMTLVGGLLLLKRRLLSPRVRATTTGADILILSLLMVQCALGLLTIPFSAQHMDGSEMMKLVGWAQSVVTFHGGASQHLDGVAFIFRVHLVLGMTLFLLFPFSRLVHIWSAPVEYLTRKYGISIPAENGVLGRLEEPSPEELEDSFLKYAGNVNASRREPNAWHPWGTPESDGFLNLTCFRMETKAVLEKAHAYDVSLTAFLCAALMMALQDMQAEQVPSLRARKPIRVQIPVNLRKLFPSSTLRNFALYTTPEIDPRLGEYSFSEICQAVKHRMGLDVNPKIMSSRIAVNVSSEKMAVVRIMPLFLKNAVMKAVFDAVGEKKSCLCFSNLGQVRLPEEMLPFVQRFDFILSAQATAPQNCSALSFGDHLYINFTRDIREPDLEAHFFRVLRDMGLGLEVQTNSRQ